MEINSHKSYTVAEAQGKLEHFCAYQERCHTEVIHKLQSLNMIPQAIDVILVHLIENNYLHEERFARSFARGKHRMKQWGKIRISNELKFRKISSYNIQTALREISPEEYHATFHSLAEKHWKSITERSLPKKKKKFCDFLLRKGFESPLIYAKMMDLTQ